MRGARKKDSTKFYKIRSILFYEVWLFCYIAEYTAGVYHTLILTDESSVGVRVSLSEEQ